jgi:hypothetical protein
MVLLFMAGVLFGVFVTVAVGMSRREEPQAVLRDAANQYQRLKVLRERQARMEEDHLGYGRPISFYDGDRTGIEARRAAGWGIKR